MDLLDRRQGLVLVFLCIQIFEMTRVQVSTPRLAIVTKCFFYFLQPGEADRRILP